MARTTRVRVLLGFAGVLALGCVRRTAGQVSFHQLYKQGQIPAALPEQPVVPAGPGIHGPGPGKAVEARPVLSCPAGFVLNGHMCQGPQYAEGTPVCSRKGEAFQDGMCVYLEHLKPFVKCPEGTQGDGKKCYLPRLGPTEAYCPPDYEQSPDGKACVKQNITKPQPVCPDGFMLKQGSCFREMRSPGVPSCPIGYQLVDDGKPACVALDRLPMEARCKDRGFVLQGGNCVQETTRPPTVKCPKEFKEENGMCLRREMIPALTTCVQGVPGKKGCVITTEAPAVPTCKKDFVLEGNTCKRFDRRPPTFNCPQGQRLKDGMCALVELLEPDFRCPPGTVQKDKHCVQATFAPAEASCEKGSELIQNQCVRIETRPPRLDCPKGQCTTEKKVSPELICPPGAQLEGKHCVIYHVEPLETICKKTGLPPGPNGCQRIDVGEPVLTCPPEFKLLGGSCVREEDGEYQLVCPPGMALTGKQITQQQCEGERVLKPEYVCPKGFALGNDRTCAQVEIEDPTPTCPPGHFISGGMCIPAMPPSPLKKHLA